MKYMEKGGFQNNPLMKLTLGLTLVFLGGLWISNFFMFYSKMGFSPDSIAAYFLGSEANYTLPRTFGSLLEVTHFHLPMMAIVILLLTHLVIFAPLPTKWKVTLIVTAFGSALINEASSWLVRYGGPEFAYLKLGSFLIFQIVFFILLAGLGLFLARPKSRRPATSLRSR